MTPPRKSFTIDTWAVTPKMIMGMLGGMMGPIVPAPQMRPALLSAS
jgi:hypothetical protein